VLGVVVAVGRGRSPVKGGDPALLHALFARAPTPGKAGVLRRPASLAVLGRVSIRGHRRVRPVALPCTAGEPPSQRNRWKSTSDHPCEGYVSRPRQDM
jgi:hypothetical protein